MTESRIANGEGVAPHDWAVITEDGSCMWVNLTQDEAVSLSTQLTATGRTQYAVPRRLADMMTDLRREAQDAAERKLEQDMKSRTRSMLGAFDVTRKLYPGIARG